MAERLVGLSKLFGSKREMEGGVLSVLKFVVE